MSTHLYSDYMRQLTNTVKAEYISCLDKGKKVPSKIELENIFKIGMTTARRLRPTEGVSVLRGDVGTAIHETELFLNLGKIKDAQDGHSARNKKKPAQEEDDE